MAALAPAPEHQLPVCSLQTQASTFRFLDLAPELRLLVYAELLERKDPDDSRSLFTEILRVNKEIHHEARPELYTKTNLRLTIEATAMKSRDWITETSLRVGNTPLLANFKQDIVISAWELYHTLPAALATRANIANITLQIILRADRHKGLLRSELIAENFNQVHQILAALVAMWKISGTLRTLNIEFLDDTGYIASPPSPPVQFTFPSTGKEMEVDQLKRVFGPLSGLGAGVKLDGGMLPMEVVEYTKERRAISVPGLHPFALYASLKSRVDNVVANVRDAGLCCTQIGSKHNKPCAIRSLEKKIAIARQRISMCCIESQQSEEESDMDLNAVVEFMEMKKVLDLVKRSEQIVGHMPINGCGK